MLHRNGIGLRVSLDVLLRTALLSQVLLVRMLCIGRHHLETGSGSSVAVGQRKLWLRFSGAAVATRDACGSAGTAEI